MSTENPFQRHLRALTAGPKVARDPAADAPPSRVVREAIILADERPALRVRDGSLPPAERARWPHPLDLGLIERAIAATVRIDSVSRWVPFHGTGFLVAPRLILTNRHVAAALFAPVGRPRGTLWRPDIPCWVAPTVERPDLDTREGGVPIVGARWIHPYFDAALLELAAELPDTEPLPLCADGVAPNTPILLVGHPYADPRNDSHAQRTVFGDVFGVERVQPGYVIGSEPVGEPGREVPSLTHDASTLGGNSGSPVIDARSGRVVGLHFGGRYLDRNYAVPSSALAADPYVRDDLFAALTAAPPAPPALVAAWSQTADPTPDSRTQPVTPVHTGDDPLSWYEATSEATLREAVHTEPDHLRRKLADALGGDEGERAFADLRSLSAFADELPRRGPEAPEIVWLPSLLGSHLAMVGRAPQRLWLHPRALATIDLGATLRLSDDGRRDRGAPPGSWIEPNGQLGMYYDKAARAWERQGLLVHRFSYDWRRSLHEAAARLDRFLSALDRDRPGRRFAFVGHGAGALVALLWASLDPERAARVHRLIGLGAPLAGCFAPVSAIDGSYSPLRRLGIVAPLTSRAGLRQLARTSPGLIELLPDPSAFPDASEVYSRAAWAHDQAPSQTDLDRARGVQHLIRSSPLLAQTLNLVSIDHPTVGSVAGGDGPIAPGPACWPGDGTVPATAAVLNGVPAYRIRGAHAALGLDDEAIDAVGDLLLDGRTSLEPLHPHDVQRPIEATTRVGRAPTESVHRIGPEDVRWMFGAEAMRATPAPLPLAACDRGLPDATRIEQHVVAVQADGALGTLGTLRSTPSQLDAIFDALADEEALTLHALDGTHPAPERLRRAREVSGWLHEHGAGHPVVLAWDAPALQGMADRLDTFLRGSPAARLALRWAAVAAGNDRLAPLLHRLGIAAAPHTEGSLQERIGADPELRGLEPSDQTGATDAAVCRQLAEAPADALAAIAAAVVRDVERSVAAGHPSIAEAAIEAVVRRLARGALGRDAWQRTQDAIARAYGPSGAGTLLVDRVARWLAGSPSRQVHLVGHGAGALHAMAMLGRLCARCARTQPVATVTLLSPTCQRSEATQQLVPFLERVGDARVFGLDDARSDDAWLPGVYELPWPRYVRGAMGAQPDAPTLGLRADHAATADLPRLHTTWAPTPADALEGERSAARRHRDFDDDEATLHSVLARVRGAPTAPLEASGAPTRQDDRALRRARQVWQYDHHALAPMPSTVGVPRPDRPNAPWLARVARVLAQVAHNNFATRRAFARRSEGVSGTHDGLLQRVDELIAAHHAFADALAPFGEPNAGAEGTAAPAALTQSDRADATDDVAARIASVYRGQHQQLADRAGHESLRDLLRGQLPGPSGRPHSFEDYHALFQTLPQPPIASTWRDDRTFAWLRVAGCNPTQMRGIQRLPDHFPVTDAHYQRVLPDDRLDAALAEGRVFLGDWQNVGAVLAPGSTDGARKYVSAPLALFAQPPQPGAPLTPIAIQCDQRPGPDNPVFGPYDGAAWGLAKAVVAVADANEHELIAHLARTHLVVETVLLATRRQLPEGHPLHTLLIPHFQGTVFINHLARTNLIAPGGAIDNFFAGTIETSQALAVTGLTTFDFSEAAVPDVVRSLHLGGLRAHPYAEDAALLWGAIERWIATYVRRYYPSADAVRGDARLQAWSATLASPIPEGGIRGFRPVGDPATLTRALTTVVFTASCQHAAVNFPQLPTMTFAPAITGAGWAPGPTGPATAADDLAFRPPLEQARQQLDVLYLLGSVHHTALGDYRSAAFPYLPVFRDAPVRAALDDFRRELKQITATIHDRNQHRLAPYPYLSPPLIPMSVNI